MKRSHAITLICAGSALVAVYAVHEKRDCDQPAPNGEPRTACRTSGGGSSGHSTYFGSGGSSSGASGSGSSGSRPSASTSSPAATSVARGGFGATGSAHSAGS